jgi:hypothetical protein
MKHKKIRWNTKVEPSFLIHPVDIKPCIPYNIRLRKFRHAIFLKRFQTLNCEGGIQNEYTNRRQ